VATMVSALCCTECQRNSAASFCRRKFDLFGGNHPQFFLLHWRTRLHVAPTSRAKIVVWSSGKSSVITLCVENGKFENLICEYKAWCVREVVPKFGVSLCVR
jgi:hypothetical protein